MEGTQSSKTTPSTSFDVGQVYEQLNFNNMHLQTIGEQTTRTEE